MSEGILFLTSQNQSRLAALVQMASELSNVGNRVRVILFGDAVLPAVKGSVEASSITNSSQAIEFLVCKEDLELRGLSQRLEKSIRALDYDEIVDLLMKNDDRVVSYV